MKNSNDLHETIKNILKTNCDIQFKIPPFNIDFINPIYAKITTYVKIIDMKSITNENKFVIVNCYYSTPENLYSFNTDNSDNIQDLIDFINNIKIN